MAIRFYLVYIRVQLVDFLAIKLIKDSRVRVCMSQMKGCVYMSLITVHSS